MTVAISVGTEDDGRDPAAMAKLEHKFGGVVGGGAGRKKTNGDDYCELTQHLLDILHEPPHAPCAHRHSVLGEKNANTFMNRDREAR